MTYSTLLRLVILAAAGAAYASPSVAQQFNRPFSFDQQNRAQLAVAMRQMETGGAGGGSVSGGGTTIVCGGGSATATANSTCIIMNNSSGHVVTDQVSDGDQTATSSEEITVNGVSQSGADEVLSTLQQ